MNRQKGKKNSMKILISCEFKENEMNKSYDPEKYCNEVNCEYYNMRMELNCSYSSDNSKCIKESEPLSSHAVLGDGWRDVKKELPVTPFLAYWTDGRITVLEEGDSVTYAITGDPEKRVVGWIPLSELGKPALESPVTEPIC